MTGTRSVIDNPPGGNGNGRFDPGETGDLVVALYNVGNQAVDGVHACLRSSDLRFMVTDSVGDYGSIPACSTRTNADTPFEIAVDPSIPLETPVFCTLLVTGSDYCDTLRFTVVVGQIRACDPIPDGPRQPPLYWAYDESDSLYEPHPEFGWVEIAGLGTMLTMDDDQTDTVLLPVGFTWQYYGQSYDRLSICSNGWVAPGSTTIDDWTNTALPTNTVPPMVCLNWDDLYPPVGNGVWYYHDSLNHRFIVEYDSVAYTAQQTVFDKFEMVLYDQTVPSPTGDNIILVQYLTANGYTSSTVGLQDPTAAIAIQCLLDGAYHRGTATLAPARAIKYSTATPLTAVGEQRRTTTGRRDVRAWPNPFSGTVAICYSPASGRPAAVAIHDLTGRIVRTLSAPAVKQGTCRVLWDGRDNTGRSVAPGIYFVGAVTGTAKDWAKLILAR